MAKAEDLKLDKPSGKELDKPTAIQLDKPSGRPLDKPLGKQLDRPLDSSSEKSAAFWSGFEKGAAGDRPVFAYRNVKKGPGHVYSVKDGGRVSGHQSDLTIRDPRFTVSAGGRDRVRREGRKNVHAGIRGKPDEAVDKSRYDWHPVTYDPKKNDQFVYRDSGEPVDKADLARLTPEGVWAGFEKRAYRPKRQYKNLEVEGLDPERRDELWSAKIDGAHSVVDMEKGKRPRLFSHRLRKHTGEKIEYTDKLPNIRRPAPVDAKVRAEVYATDKKGRAVHPDTITALLNRSPENSRNLLKEMGIKTKAALIDVDEVEGEDVSRETFDKKLSILKDIAKNNPDFTLPQIATGPKSKAKMLERIRRGEHPQTREGVVVHKKEEGSPPGKGKFTDDHDVYVRRIFREEGTKEGRTPMAGGFDYSWSPGGSPAGRVGTGFDHAMKQDMLKNPEKYLHRAARVKAHDLSKNQALIKPSFLGWHVDKNIGQGGSGPSKPGRSGKATKPTKTTDLGEPGMAKQTVVVNKRQADTEEKAREIAKRYSDNVGQVHETKQSFRFRQRDPGEMRSNTYKTFKPEDGVAIVMAEPN